MHPHDPAPPPGESDLFDLVSHGHGHDVRAALAAGADVHRRFARRTTPLMLAALLNDDVSLVRAQLDAGARVHARGAGRRRTALMLAAAYRTHPAIVAALVAAGAEVDARDRNGRTAAGADLSARTRAGETPLILAIRRGHDAPVVRSLLAAGADPHAIDDDGVDARWITRLQRAMGSDDADRRIVAALGRGAT